MLINEDFFEFSFILNEGTQIQIIKVKNDVIVSDCHIRHCLFLLDSNFTTINSDEETNFGNLIYIMNEEETPFICEIVFSCKNNKLAIQDKFKHKLFHNITSICANGSFYNNLKTKESESYVYVQYQNGDVYKYFLKQDSSQNNFPFEKFLEVPTSFSIMVSTNFNSNNYLLYFLKN